MSSRSGRLQMSPATLDVAAKIARQLGIGRSTLYRKIKEYGLDEETGDFPDPETVEQQNAG